MNKKIIFLDCDGTIFDVPRNMPHISEKTGYAIKELIKNGHIVFIASGRCKCILPSEVVELNPSGYITCNGAYCYTKDKLIYCDNVDEKLVLEFKDYCKKNKGVYFLETPENIYVEDLNNPVFKEFVNTWGIGFDCFREDIKDISETQMMMSAFRSEEECDRFEELFKDKFDVNKQYGFTSFDVSQKEIDKGKGVRKVIEYYGLSIEDAYAFGDGLNDIGMLKAVKNSYCMANGNPKTKMVAKYIAPDVLDDGFYFTMVDLGLIDPIMKKM